MVIPFNRPCTTGREFEYMQAAVENMKISGDGFFSKQCHSKLESLLGVKKALLTTSCTSALEMAALLLNLQPGDEIIIPSFTFVSSVNAFVMRGAQPIFVDIRADTLNLNEQLVEQAITPKTRAIVVVHYAGIGCEMDAIIDIAERHGIVVIEDNAHGLFGQYRGRKLGTFGTMATLSFHETKNITCGEGGALLLNQAEWIERAEIIREKGTNRSQFFRGQIDKYTWVDVGSSYLPSDILAAFLLAQLESYEQIQEKRRRIWEYYYEALAEWAQANGVSLPVIPSHCDQSYHMFYLLMPSLKHRQSMLAHLKEHEIVAVFHYLPLHCSPVGLRLGGKPGACPVTEDVSDRLLRLPFFNDLTSDDLQTIVSAIKNYQFS